MFGVNASLGSLRQCHLWSLRPVHLYELRLGWPSCESEETSAYCDIGTGRSIGSLTVFTFFFLYMVTVLSLVPTGLCAHRPLMITEVTRPAK